MLKQPTSGFHRADGIPGPLIALRHPDLDATISAAHQLQARLRQRTLDVLSLGAHDGRTSDDDS